MEGNPPTREELEVQKLQWEVRQLAAALGAERWLNRVLQAVTGLLALAAFWFGVYQFKHQSEETRNATTRQADDTMLGRKREAQKPFFEQQLTLYLQAADVASRVATAPDADARRTHEANFWSLYWGTLAVVEDVHPSRDSTSRDVEGAMIRFGRLLKQDHATRGELEQGSLAIAHAVQNSIRATWDVNLPAGESNKTPPGPPGRSSAPK